MRVLRCGGDPGYEHVVRCNDVMVSASVRLDGEESPDGQHVYVTEYESVLRILEGWALKGRGIVRSQGPNVLTNHVSVLTCWAVLISVPNQLPIGCSVARPRPPYARTLGPERRPL